MIKKSVEKIGDVPGHELIVILSGGGDDIERIIKDISRRGVFKGKTVAYVAIAAETNQELLTLITQNFATLRKTIQSYGATDVSLITSQQFNDIFYHNVVILSGGDTAYLLDVFQKNRFPYKIKKHLNIQALIGISAGAIVLAQAGVGTLHGHRHKYQGMGLINITVVPHSNPELVRQYNGALHLKEYQLYEYPGLVRD